MILTIYDLSGIQNFIFSTNKLKEIIGASKIASMALFENIPDMLGEDSEKWKKEKFSFESVDTKKIVYIGGGNALMVFDSENTEKQFTKELSERIFFQSGGAIRLCSASIILSENKSLAENQRKLMEKLDAEKKKPGNLMPSLCAPFVAYDNNNYEALVYENGECLTRSRRAKLKAYPLQSKAFRSVLPDGKEFTTEFDKFAKDGEKNYLAIIHIDGNTMGIKIREFVESLKTTIIPSFDEMKNLSVKISELYKEVLRETASTVFKETDGELPFRPIIADGDDITIMLDSHYAFKFVETFFENLNGKEIFGEGFVPTAAAGIVFSKISFPFSVAYDLAEQCCRNAKKETLNREGSPKNSMDFQVIYSGVNENLNTMRNEIYKTDTTGSHIRRPYIVDDKNSDYSYSKFIDTAKSINDMQKEKIIARRKLKGLRDAYSGGNEETQRYLNYIKSHTKSENENEAIRIIGNLFKSKNESILFDYLDVMDIAWERGETNE